MLLEELDGGMAFGFFDVDDFGVDGRIGECSVHDVFKVGYDVGRRVVVDIGEKVVRADLEVDKADIANIISACMDKLGVKERCRAEHQSQLYKSSHSRFLFPTINAGIWYTGMVFACN